jgi:hypothetical protein
MDRQDQTDLDRIERKAREEEREYRGSIYADLIPRRLNKMEHEALRAAGRDMEKAKECGDYAKRSIERGDDEGARIYGKLAASWGGRVSHRQLEEIQRKDREDKIDSCVYHIEQSRSQAKGLEKDARDAEKHGDFEVAKTLSHAAVREWRRVEFYQQHLLDLTRE